MTTKEYQENYSGELRKFYDTNCGKELLGQISGLRPPLKESFSTEHDMIRAYGKIEGYEMCLRNLIALSLPAKNNDQPVANYGVDDPQPKDN